MKDNHSKLLLVLVPFVSVLFAGFTVAQSHTDQENVISVRKLQIVDASGRPRIVLGTDDQETASVTFMGVGGAPSSVIKQFPHGAMRIEFAGTPSKAPSVVLTSDAAGVGPALMMHGIGRDQVIMLGFNAQEGEKPGEPGKVWGLFFPGPTPFSNLAAIGAQRGGGDKASGFIIPQDRR